MVGIVNARASRRNIVAATMSSLRMNSCTLWAATDKYDLATAQPIGACRGWLSQTRHPLYPAKPRAEIMGGRIALAENDAVIPKSLKYAVIGQQTASEIRLID